MLERFLSLRDYCDNESNCKKFFHSSHWLPRCDQLLHDNVLAPTLERSFLKSTRTSVTFGEFCKNLVATKIKCEIDANVLLDAIWKIRKSWAIDGQRYPTIVNIFGSSPKKRLGFEKINRAKMYLGGLSINSSQLKSFSIPRKRIKLLSFYFYTTTYSTQEEDIAFDSQLRSSENWRREGIE